MAKRLSLESAGPSSSRDERSAENRIVNLSDGDGTKIFLEIARRLSPENYYMLGLRLGLDINVLTELDKDCNIGLQGQEFKIVRMLDKWKSKTNPNEDQLVPLLTETLRNVNRKDIADFIEQKFHHGSHNPLSDLQNQMKAMQKNSFKILLLPRDLWLTKKRLLLEELYVKLTMTRKSKMGIEKGEIGIEEIFDEIESKIPRRILIEGQPGYGKTTLVTKLLSDWSKGENYISERFDLVFVIALRTFKGDLSSHFHQQCQRVEGCEDVKLKAIKDIEERVLLLLDGLDEIPTGDKENLYRLFEGNDYPLMTVVVTCRTGFLPKDKTSSDNTFQASANKGFEMDIVWDKRVEIQGISFEERKLFIQKYLNIDYEELEEKLDDLDLLRNKLYECPLFLLILAVLIQEKGIRQIKTKTELYKTIFNFVINKGLDKLKGNKKEIDVFDLKSESDEFGCQSLLLNFGRLCLEKMKKQTLIFEESELLKCSGDGNGDQDLILKLGFLSKQISFSNYEEKEHYEPIHRSFLEFSAAYFLSSFDGMEQEIQEFVLKYDIWPNTDQLLYPFLGGLLHSNAFKLFNALSAFKNFITIFNDYYGYNLENVLFEIHQTGEIIKSLGNLPIGDWRNVKYQNSLHKWYVELLKYCTKYDDILTVNVSKFLNVINEISDIQINTVYVDVDEEATNLRCRNIHCQHLVITMREAFEDSAQILKEIIKKINAENISLEINCSYRSWLQKGDYTDHVITFFKKISQFDFVNCNFYHLSVEPVASSLWCSISPYIQALIKQKKIEFGVHVGFEKDPIKNEFSSFVETVFNSYLQSFSVENYWRNEPLPFPINSLVNENQMQYISLSGKFEEMKSVSLLQLIFNASPKSFPLKKLLKKCQNVKGLKCDDYFICQLGDDDSICEWKGFETIVQLGISESITGMSDKEFRKGISLFQNLQQLYLYYRYSPSGDIKFIARLPSLKKIYFDKIDIKFLKELLVLNEQKGESGLGLEELEIGSLLFDERSSIDIMKCIEDCFIKKVFFLFLISSTNKYSIRVFCKYFHLKDEFKLSYRIKKQPHDIFELNYENFCLQKLK